MAAAAALAEHGCRVEVFERQKYLGGRASSFHDPELGVWLDHCRHVSLGCCTNFHDFCRRVGVADAMARHGTLHFIAPSGRQHRFIPSRWLPAPLHLAPALWRLQFLSVKDRIGIGRALGQLARRRLQAGERQQSMAAWLRRQGQSDRAIELFWSVVLLSALSESLDRIAVPVARKIFVDGMMAARDSQVMYLPTKPLHELFHRRASDWLVAKGVVLHAGNGIDCVFGSGQRVAGVILADGGHREFDFVVLAVPWRRVHRLVPAEILAQLPELASINRFESAPITAVHLAFDRPITPLPHAVLPGRLSQWLFEGPAGDGYQAYEVVISASRELAGMDRDELVSHVQAELADAFPTVLEARLLHARVATHPAAVFSPLPGIEECRPAQLSAVAGLLLAGDWTATDWPATMESAVRSGYLAAECVLQAAGHSTSILVEDLPWGRLASWTFVLPRPLRH